MDNVQTVGYNENIYHKILELIMSFPFYPSDFEADNTSVKWNTLDSVNSIGLFTEKGSVYVKKYVSGSYIAEINVQIVFRSSPTTNKTSINAQSILQSLATWLTMSDVDFEDENIKIEKIEQTEPTVVIYQDETVTDYGCEVSFRYLYTV